MKEENFRHNEYNEWYLIMICGYGLLFEILLNQWVDFCDQIWSLND